MSLFFGLLSFVALIVFIVGMIKPGWVVFWTNNKTRKWGCMYLAAFVVLFIVGVSIPNPAPDTNPVVKTSNSAPARAGISSATGTPAATSSATTAPVDTTPATINVDKTLGSGFYTVGTDIPSGTYSFKATSGGGNVMTEDGSINEIMGVSSKGSGYQPTFSNANLTDGAVLEIAGVTLEVTCGSASGVPLQPRSQSITGTKQFSAGNYTAGKDFPAGTYDLKALSGGGNVTTADGKLNAIMGTDDDTYEKTYSNVELDDGAVLQISGATISMTPSK